MKLYLFVNWLLASSPGESDNDNDTGMSMGTVRIIIIIIASWKTSTAGHKPHAWTSTITDDPLLIAESHEYVC